MFGREVISRILLIKIGTVDAPAGDTEFLRVEIVAYGFNARSGDGIFLGLRVARRNFADASCKGGTPEVVEIFECI